MEVDFGVVQLCILHVPCPFVFVLVRYQHGPARGTKSRLPKLCPVAPLPGQSSTSPLGEAELWFGRGALRNARDAGIRTYGSSVCF